MILKVHPFEAKKRTGIEWFMNNAKNRLLGLKFNVFFFNLLALMDHFQGFLAKSSKI